MSEELAKRVEALTADDRSGYAAVAKDIYRALHGAPELGHPGSYGWREDDAGWWLATGEDARTPPKTIYPPKWLTSLDAAMTLVPGGWNYCLTHICGRYDAVLNNSPDGRKAIIVYAATPALALTAAALRARAMMGTE